MPEIPMRCLRCGFTDSDALECPHCRILTAAVYLAGEICRECGLKGGLRTSPDRYHETYKVSDDRIGTYTFDVTWAQALAESHGALIDVPDEALLHMLQVNVTEPRHYEHIPNPFAPGIVAEVVIAEHMIYAIQRR